MVIDTSAVVAVLFSEPDASQYARAITSADAPCISTGSVLECSLVLERRYGDAAVGKLDQLLAEQQIQVVPFDDEQLSVARAAFRRFGRGRHPAALNFGDCFAYALAISRSLPLLFKGKDFAQTDVQSAL